MAAKDDLDPAALAKRLWFPGPAAPYSTAQRLAISRLVVDYVERVCAAAADSANYRRPSR